MRGRWDRFWFGFSLSSAHLALFRVGFFAVLAIDCWLQISHAPRYNANGFNVAHFHFIDALAPAPERPLMLVLFALQAYLAAAFAIGALHRMWLWVLTGLFGYTYFISQLNSYQHHWMMFLVLLALCFVRWDPRDRAARPAGPSLGDWPVRLVLVSMSLVYGWAVLAKWEPGWMDGITISQQISEGWTRQMIVRFLDMRTGDLQGAWSRAAIGVMLLEATLAVVIHVRWLRLPAAIAGCAFHLSIEFSGFQIGLFSYFMMALYLLVLPVDDLCRWLSPWLPWLAPKRADSPEPRPPGHLGRGLAYAGLALVLGFCCLALSGGLGSYLVVLALLAASADQLWRHRRSRPALPPTPAPWKLAASSISVLAGAALVGALLPFEETRTLAVSVAMLGALILLVAWGRERCLLHASAAHLVACLALVALFHTTDAARDYYRFWGGSSRRLGDQDTAVWAYTRLTEIEPEYASGFSSLGRLLAKTEPERALQLYQRAQELDPSDYRAFLLEARLHHAAGRGEQAYRAARMAEALSPGNRSAATIMDYWRHRR